MLFTALKERVAADRRRDRFEDLVRQVHRPAFSFAYRLTGNGVEAEDLVQEATLRAFRFFDRYDDRYPFSAWLFRIVANTHVDLVRRKGRLRTLSLEGEDGAWECPDANASADAPLLRRTLEEPLQRALGEMNPEFRTAVLLADVEGLAYEEVAEVMNTSVGTVRSRIHRGRRQLREHLRRHHPEQYARLATEEAA